MFSVGAIEEIATKTGSTLRKRELVLDCSRFSCNQLTGETTKYENYPSFEFRNTKVDKLDGLTLGDMVKVSFDINGRFFQRKDGTQGHMNSIDGFNVERVETQPTQQPPVAPQYPQQVQPTYPQYPQQNVSHPVQQGGSTDLDEDPTLPF